MRQHDKIIRQTKFIHFLNAICTVLILISCGGAKEIHLAGTWKPTKVTYIGQMNYDGPVVIYDEQNNDSIKLHTLRRYLSEKNVDSALFIIDTVKFKTDLANEFLKYDSSKLILFKDSSFFMKSFGLIVPTAEPSWHFGDTLAGKWLQNEKDFLTLQTGDEKLSYRFLYKIITLTKDKLILGQTIGKADEPHIKLEFSRK